jgi:hypothetical protein
MMESHHGNRARFGGVLIAVALSALALLALPAVGLGSGPDSVNAHRAAGKIESFDRKTGLLVVDLFRGRKIAGIVVRHRTQVRCNDRHWHHLRRKRRTRRGIATGSATRTPVTDVDARGDKEPSPTDDVRIPEEPESEPETEAGDDSPVDVDRPRHCHAHLVPGAIVLRAEMVLVYGDAFFKRIAILPPAAVVTPGVSDAN